MLFKIILSIVIFYSVALASSGPYDGYKIYDIQPKSRKEMEIVNRLAENPQYDFFFLPTTLAEAARVMVQPEDQNNFEQKLNDSRIMYKVVEQNVGRTAELKSEPISVRSRSSAADSIGIFTRFQRHDEINNYLDMLAESYSHRVTVKTIGQSYQGRDLKIIEISNGECACNKKVILIDAGIHAREWIAPAAALFVIRELVVNFDKNRHLLKDYNWVILPVVNPDGYEHTHNGNRLWRKTMKPVTERCNGTDANRNFQFHWGEVGASANPCDVTFKGREAFSEPETQALRHLMLSLTGTAKMYLSLHSYGKYILYPWGYTSELPSDWKELHEIGRAGATAIWKATRNEYRVGSSGKMLQEAAGGSDDYAFAVAKIPISFTMELPAGGSGFDPDSRYILPMAAETWVGIKAMAEKVISKY